MKNVLQSLVAALIVASIVFMLLSFSGNEYQVHVTSDTFPEKVENWNIEAILDSKGDPVPAKDWDKVLESGDYTPVPVASLEIRKRYTSAAEGRY